jgi:hypothetical protein
VTLTSTVIPRSRAAKLRFLTATFTIDNGRQTHPLQDGVGPCRHAYPDDQGLLRGTTRERHPIGTVTVAKTLEAKFTICRR